MNNGGAGLGRNRRTNLLPAWIRFFSWIFLFNPLLPVYFLMLRHGGKIGFPAFGYYYQGSIYHPVPIFVVVFDLFAAFAAFCLLRGMKNGILYGMICGYAGVVASILNLINNSIHFWEKGGSFRTLWNDGHMDGSVVPPHLFLLIPFMIVLTRRRRAWESVIEGMHAPAPPIPV